MLVRLVLNRGSEAADEGDLVMVEPTQGRAWVVTGVGFPATRFMLVAGRARTLLSWGPAGLAALTMDALVKRARRRMFVFMG